MMIFFCFFKISVFLHYFIFLIIEFRPRLSSPRTHLIIDKVQSNPVGDVVTLPSEWSSSIFLALFISSLP